MIVGVAAAAAAAATVAVTVTVAVVVLVVNVVVVVGDVFDAVAVAAAGFADAADVTSAESCAATVAVADENGRLSCKHCYCCRPCTHGGRCR